MKTANERQREIIRTTTFLQALANRLGVIGHYQFAAKYDEAFPGLASTQASGKWRDYFNGIRPLSSRLLISLGEIFTDAAQLYRDGKNGLWRALWGDERTELWTLCRTRYCDLGAALDDKIWRAIQDEFSDEKTFGAALRKFEEEILFSHAYGEPLTINHLVEAIAFYRLHAMMNSVAPFDVDGMGAYRCVRACLNDRTVRVALDCLGVFEFVAGELATMEKARLHSEPSCRLQISVENIPGYAADPGAFVSDDQRWSALGYQ